MSTLIKKIRIYSKSDHTDFFKKTAIRVFMQKNINLLNQIKESSHIDPSEVLGVQTVERIKNQKPEERVLIVTLFNFFLFIKKPIVKRYSLSRQYRWDFLKALSLKGNDINLIFQEESIIIQAPNAGEIAYTIVNTICRIFTRYEFPKLNIDKKILD